MLKLPLLSARPALSPAHKMLSYLTPSLSLSPPPFPPPCSNCLFRALAGQLHERRVTHQSLRRDIVHYMRQHRAEFEPFVAEDGSYDEYCEWLLQHPIRSQG